MLLRSFSSSETDVKASDRRQSPRPNDGKDNQAKQDSPRATRLSTKKKGWSEPTIKQRQSIQRQATSRHLSASSGCFALEHLPCHSIRLSAPPQDSTGICPHLRRFRPIAFCQVRHPCHDRHPGMQLLRSSESAWATKDLVVWSFSMTASTQL